MKIIINIIRFLVGALFIFSGMIKGNDPMGTSYKLQEYFTIFGMGFLNPTTDYLSIIFCGLEIALGFIIWLGSYSRISTLLLLALIIFFTWLTGYSAITGKVTDCGCFGEFIKLQPLHSFYKDIILLVLSVCLVLGHSYITPIFGLKWTNFLLVICIVFSFFIPVYAFNHLPFIDMLAYKPGNNLIEQMKLPPNAKKDSVQTVMICINKQTGKEEELSVSEYTKNFQNYTYKDRRDKVIIVGDKAPIHDFVISDAEGNPMQDSLLHNKDYSFWVVVYDVNDADKSCFVKINELVKQCEQNKVNILGITHNNYEETETFRHSVQAAFPFYYAGDDKFVKTMMRSNPGIMLMKDGTVVKKWHYKDIPTFIEAMGNR